MTEPTPTAPAPAPAPAPADRTTTAGGPAATPAGDGRPIRPAGIVTRVLAAGVDLATVLLAAVGIELGAAALRYVLSPVGFTWPTLSLLASALAVAVMLGGYMAVGWGTTGRTWGAALLGLRVLSDELQRLGKARALLRAVLCVLMPIGLFWVAVSRRRRSLQDLVVHTVVVYDWHHAGSPAGILPATGTEPGRSDEHA